MSTTSTKIKAMVLMKKSAEIDWTKKKYLLSQCRDTPKRFVFHLETQFADEGHAQISKPAN